MDIPISPFYARELEKLEGYQPKWQNRRCIDTCLQLLHVQEIVVHSEVCMLNIVNGFVLFFLEQRTFLQLSHRTNLNPAFMLEDVAVVYGYHILPT